MSTMYYMKLIEKAKKEHLCTVEFLPNSIILKKQIGNKDGSQIEIEFSDSKKIMNIKFVAGGYNEPNTLKQDFNKLFDLIIST